MRGRTLLEKRHGVGMREGPVQVTTAPWSGCGAEGCGSQPAGSIELYVDESMPIIDWYSRLLSKLPPRVWVRVAFCLQHLEAVVERGEEIMENVDSWAPGAVNPPVLPRSVRGVE